MSDNYINEILVRDEHITKLEAENAKLKLERETAILNWEEGNKEIERLKIQLSDERLAFDHANEIIGKLEYDLAASELTWQTGAVPDTEAYYWMKSKSGWNNYIVIGVQIDSCNDTWAGPIQEPSNDAAGGGE